MADISKINAVLIANIAEIDDVLAANIAKVNGLVFSTAPAFTGLLDTYTGAAAAYSTRRLYSLYTGAALRVREDSGDTETDIGFDSNGDLDTAAIATHCGSANGYVTKWYGQESSGGTGSGNDAAQATSGIQPQIYNGTAVITENGKPSLEFGDDDEIRTPFDTSSTDFDLPQTMVLATRYLTGGSYQNFNFIVCGGGINAFGKFEMWTRPSAGTYTQLRTGSGSGTAVNANVSDHTSTAMYLQTGIWGSSNMKIAYNGGSIVTGGATNSNDNTITTLALGSQSAITGTFRTSEWITWPVDQDTQGNKSGIEGNVNAYFQIGNFGTPTSGLLYDYSGAAAAYSVRQLANTAALAMRIREDGTDTETDIGFDSNGDLDTAAISSHCGSNNGYVVTWYDQAGSQKDATQGTSGSQPQIYDAATGLITDNGKPALSFNADELTTAQIWPAGSSNRAYAMVAKPNNNSNRWLLVHGHSDTATHFIITQEYYLRLGGGVTYNLTGAASTSQTSIFVDGSATNLNGYNVYFNGTIETGTRNNGATTIATSNNVDTPSIGSAINNQVIANIQEVICWNSDQSSNRSGIETDINGYFSIYT